YCVFDLVEAGGEDLTPRPLGERRAVLERTIRPMEALRISEVWRDDAERRYAEACRAGWEGLIAKRADAPYGHGTSRDWFERKCVRAQGLVSGGSTAPAGSRTAFGALLVGYYDGGLLRYAGKVGTGYSAARLTELGSRLRNLETREPPFADARSIPRGTHWTRP